MTIVRCFMVAVLSTAPLWASSGTEDQVVDTTVCELTANPAKFDGKLIRIRGNVDRNFEFLSISGDKLDDAHGPGLKRPSTLAPIAKCDERVLILDAHELKSNAETEKFDRALREFKTRIKATFVGTLRKTGGSGYVRNDKGKVIGFRTGSNVPIGGDYLKLIVTSISDVEFSETSTRH